MDVVRPLTSNSHQRIPALDALRGLAVIAVAFYHFGGGLTGPGASGTPVLPAIHIGARGRHVVLRPLGLLDHARPLASEGGPALLPQLPRSARAADFPAVLPRSAGLSGALACRCGGELPGKEPGQWAYLGLMLSLTSVLAVVSWYAVEEPFLRLKRFFEVQRAPQAQEEPIVVEAPSGAVHRLDGAQPARVGRLVESDSAVASETV